MPTLETIALPNGLRFRPSTSIAMSRSDGDEATPILGSARRRSGIGSASSRFLPLPSSGSLPLRIAAARSVSSCGEVDDVLVLEALDLHARELAPAFDRGDEEHIGTLTRNDVAADDANVELGDVAQHQRDRATDQMRRRDFVAERFAPVDEAEQRRRVDLDRTVNLRVDRRPPHRVGDLAPPAKLRARLLGSASPW